MSRNLRMAVVGLGNVGNLHARSARTLDGLVELVGGVDVDSAKREAFSATFGCPTFASVPEMIDKLNGGVNFATVGTPQMFRREPVMALIKGGISVLVEKPFASSPIAGREMLAAAHEAQVIVGGVSQRAFYEPVKRMKRAIVEGTVQPVAGVVQIYGHRDRSYYAGAAFRGKRGDGGVFNQFAHYIANLVHLLGPIVSVQGEIAKHTHDYIEAEDWSSALLRFQGGVTVTFIGTNCVKDRSAQSGTIKLIGKDESIIGCQLDAEMFVAGGPPPSTGPFTNVWTAEGSNALDLQRWQSEERQLIRDIGPMDVYYHALQIKNFAEALLGDADLVVPGADLQVALEATAAMHLSAFTGRRINVPLSDSDAAAFDRWLETGEVESTVEASV